MGYFYVGGDTYRKTIAYVKIGETNQKYLHRRVREICVKEKHFTIFKYLKIENSTSALTKAVEGHVRLMLEREGYLNLGLDHFGWSTTPTEKLKEYCAFTESAVKYAIEYCEMIGASYQIFEGDYTRPFTSAQEYLDQINAL